MAVTRRRENHDNPNLQCERCGRWYRLRRAGGDQWLYPALKEGYPPEKHHILDEYGEFETLCVPCHITMGLLEPEEKAT